MTGITCLWAGVDSACLHLAPGTGGSRKKKGASLSWRLWPGKMPACTLPQAQVKMP